MPTITDDQIIAAYAKMGGNKKQAAAYLGMPRTTFRRALKRLTANSDTFVTDGKSTEPINVSEGRDDAIITWRSRDRPSGEEIAKRAGFDLSEWSVDRCEAMQHETPMKVAAEDKIAHGDDGKSHKLKGADTPVIVQLWYCKVKLVRRVPKSVQQGMEDCWNRMLGDWSPPFIPYVHQSVTDPHMLFASPNDAHIGKYCWADETGHDYDLDLAETIFQRAIEDLIHKSGNFGIEQIRFPVGSDFVHIDNRSGTTTNGTAQDFDSRYAKIVSTAQAALVRSIDFALSVAPVCLDYVPGNHDRTTAWHLINFLKAYYDGRGKHVTVDTTPRSRKYVRYGVNVVGMSHGDQEKHADLARIMLDETRMMWDLRDVQSMEFLAGHGHRRKHITFQSTVSHGPVTFRMLPSLSATDAWHYENGYVGNDRAAEAYLYSKADGYVGHFSSSVKR